MSDPIASALAALVIAAIPFRFRSMFRRRPLVPGRRAHGWTGAAMFLAIAGLYAGAPAVLLAGAARPAWPAAAAGLAVWAAGLALRAYGIRTLGAWFSPHIEIRDDHPFIRHGPYRYVRHPNYAGLLLEGFGLAVSVQSPAILLVAAAGLLPAVLLRLHLEEQALAARFGADYADYRRRVGALIPHVRRKA